MKTRTVLYADDDMMLTDGEHYGKIVYIAEGESADAWHEITEAEYEATLAESEDAGA